MRRANRYLKNKNGTETYVKLSDVHRDFSEWCNNHRDKLKDLDPISEKYFHYYINLLPCIELVEDEYLDVSLESRRLVRRKISKEK